MPPNFNIDMDIEAVSGILGSISIACWVVVFTPQIVENFRRSSATGLSLTFIVIWLLGDVFNILGAVMQGVLPTMIVLAIYYTLADIVLLAQCIYYWKYDSANAKATQIHDYEQAPLLSGNGETRYGTEDADSAVRRHSGENASYGGVDGTHLSPAVPLHEGAYSANQDAPAARNMKPGSMVQAIAFNTVALLLVCVAGAFGWWVSASHETHRHRHGHRHNAPYFSKLSKGGSDDHHVEQLDFDLWGQIFGYLCAVFYLGSRVPQLMLNYRRKSTDGLNALFFLFACAGNLTYVLSIFAYEPPCSKADSSFEPLGEPGQVGILSCRGNEWKDQYLNYLLINLSWLIGSAGTLFLDFGIFVQFWMYQGMRPDE